MPQDRTLAETRVAKDERGKNAAIIDDGLAQVEDLLNDFWARRWITTGSKTLFKEGYPESVEEFVARNIRAITPSQMDRLIDVGCGADLHNIQMLLDKFPAIKKIHGMDVFSRKILASSPYSGKIIYSVGQFQNTRFSDSAFHAFISTFAVEYAKDLDGAVREMRRITDEDGVGIVAIHHYSSPILAYMAILYKECDKLFDELLRIQGWVLNGEDEKLEEFFRGEKMDYYRHAQDVIVQLDEYISAKEAASSETAKDSLLTVIHYEINALRGELMMFDMLTKNIRRLHNPEAIQNFFSGHGFYAAVEKLKDKDDDPIAYGIVLRKIQLTPPQDLCEGLREPRPETRSSILRPLSYWEGRKKTREEKRTDLVPPEKYPFWVAQSIEHARVCLEEIGVATRQMTAVMREAGFDTPDCMGSLREAAAQLERLAAIGSSYPELKKFAELFNTSFQRDRSAVLTGWYAEFARDEFYDVPRRHAFLKSAEDRVEEIVMAKEKVKQSEARYLRLYRKMVEYVNGLTLYLVVRPYDTDSELQRMFRKEDQVKIDKRLKRVGFNPEKARQLVAHALATRAKKVLRKALPGGNIVIDDATVELMARDVTRHIYPGLSRMFIGVADDAAQLAEIRQALQDAKVSDRENLFVELIDIVDRGYANLSADPAAMADEDSVVTVRHAAQDVIFTHIEEVNRFPALLDRLHERVFSWMARETHFKKWDSLLRLFGDFADRPEDLIRLRELYRINGDFGIALQIIAVYTQVMTNIHTRAQGDGAVTQKKYAPSFYRSISEPLAQIDAFTCAGHSYDPVISRHLKSLRMYVVNHWAHWGTMRELPYLWAELRGGPMTFTHAMIWSESAVDARAPDLWKEIEIERIGENGESLSESRPYPTELGDKEKRRLIDRGQRMASEKLRTYLVDIIKKQRGQLVDEEFYIAPERQAEVAGETVRLLLSSI